ncbi:MAG: cohesin domain-containing protein [Myxococcota bacterium]|nr:cohesin domain-containing protein [Myxococcota bacterium]
MMPALPLPRLIRPLAALAAALLLTLATGGAHALNELRLVAPAAPVAVGDALDVALQLDFDETTLGGAVAVSYDASVLGLIGVTFDGALPDDPDFRCPSAGLPGSVSCPGTPGFVSFGTLAGLPTGQALAVATLGFTALAPGTSPLGLAVASPFSDPVGAPLGISRVGTSVQVVPEPAPALLAAGAVALAAGLRRRRRAR